MKRALLVEREIDIDRRLQDSEMVAAIPVKGRKLTDVKIGELPSMTRMWDFTPETLLEHLKAVTTGSTTDNQHQSISRVGVLSVEQRSMASALMKETADVLWLWYFYRSTLAVHRKEEKSVTPEFKRGEAKNSVLESLSALLRQPQLANG
ncbi:hypothetical protein JEQ12_004000 [Ovis aries]|uniref:Uncharacterized protein n=1 Tax=Ovis aries TaxID=9940 RepID=A0A835ZV93_SHEEP|nr:hypothetical protein JEQ12_004000 [Ovis aries]